MSCRTVLLYCFAFLLFPMVALSDDRAFYAFDSSGISRNVLENYLRRSATITEFLTVDPFGIDGPYPNKEDDIRLIKNTGIKFVGRAIYRWGREHELNDPAFLDNAKLLMQKVLADDPDVIFQACLFEIVTQNVNAIAIPAWAFETLNLPVEQRHFDYEKMLNPDGKFVNHWRNNSSVPDISQTETKLWFVYLGGTYMDLGCEAFHLGQVALMGMNDPGWKHWQELVAKLRELAQTKTRRGWLLLDAHTPHGGMVTDGKSLLDFNSFPLRIKEVVDQPQQAILEVGYLDALFGRSLGCVTPSGWSCDALPYLVEFDNFGVTRTPGQETLSTHFIWGYDEVSWLFVQDEAFRKEWLKYAWYWVREHDENAFLQMPVSRVVSLGPGGRSKFRANTKSDTMPDGLNLEDTIKELLLLPENQCR